MKKHSKLTDPRIATTVDQIKKEVEKRQEILHIDKNEEKKRKECLLRAIIFLFKSIGRKDWKDCNPDNFLDKLKALDKITKTALKKMVIFDPDELNSYEHYSGKKQ